MYHSSRLYNMFQGIIVVEEWAGVDIFTSMSIIAVEVDVGRAILTLTPTKTNKAEAEGRRRRRNIGRYLRARKGR